MDQLHWRPSHWYILGLQAQDKKDYFDLRCDFLQKSYSNQNKVEKPVLVTTSYEGLDDEEKLKMVEIINENKNISNVVSDSDSDNDNDNDNKKVFDKDIDDKFEANSKITFTAKVVQVMKKLQTS